MKTTPARTRWAKERRGLVGRNPVNGWYPPADLPAEALPHFRAQAAKHDPPGTCRKHPWCRAKTHHPDCPIATR